MIPDQQPTDIVHESERVQQRTTAYAEGREDHVHDQRQEKSRPPSPVRIDSRDVIVSFRITSSLADRIDIYKSQHYKRSKTEAFTNLLETALYILENAQRLDDPILVKYFWENLYKRAVS